MPKTIEKLTRALNQIEPDQSLLNRILALIEKKQLAKLRSRLILLTLLISGSIIALIPVSRLAWSGLNETGFFSFGSLLFSDFGTVLAYWQSFGLSLLESLPVMDLLLWLAVIFVFFESLKLLIKNLRIIFNPLVRLTNN